MTSKIRELIEKLAREHSLTPEEYAELIDSREDESAALLAERALEQRRAVYGNDVYVRGLIEISNYCKNNCFYCGIRGENPNCVRYRLTSDEILACCKEGYSLGFRTFVLQGGEDGWFTDERLCEIIRRIKEGFPACAVTLSLGERGKESFKRLFDAGADRYLLRHESADPALYSKLHPPKMSFENRIRSLYELRDIGYQVGCGFMVGAPFQTTDSIVMDLKLIESFMPEMCGIGPFIAQHDTVFRDHPSGTAELTVYLLSIIRLIHPRVLLPATTALATVDPLGREKGLKAGANVVMPNLSPVAVREKYQLYDGKVCTGEEAAQCKDCLAARVAAAGFKIVTARGDFKNI